MLVPSHLAFPEGLEHFNDVRSHSDVDQHELGELITGEATLGQEPPAEDEDNKDDLKKDNNE